MFCPNCRYEYLPAVITCPDCGVALVHELPPEPKDKDIVDEQHDLATVFASYDRPLIAIAKSVLDENGIEYYIKGEGMVRWRNMPLEVQVFENRVAEAQELLKDLDQSEIMPEDDPFTEDKEP